MAEAGYAEDAVFRFYVVLFILNLMSERGQRFNGNERPSDPQIRQWLQVILEREMERVTVQHFPIRLNRNGSSG